MSIQTASVTLLVKVLPSDATTRPVAEEAK
jgi:hypothetical protein